MSVSTEVILPAQPTIGNTELLPLGGDGKAAPHGCYVVRAEVDGDAGGGSAQVTITLDSRYTNLVAWVNVGINVDAAAGDFVCVLQPGDGNEGVTIVGTIPQVATTVATRNAAFLWYPPPIYYRQKGQILVRFLNVSATEDYVLAAQIYTFDPNVTQLAPLPILQLNVPGVSAPASV